MKLPSKVNAEYHSTNTWRCQPKRYIGPVVSQALKGRACINQLQPADVPEFSGEKEPKQNPYRRDLIEQATGGCPRPGRRIIDWK
jgi:hypothetical protein